jgi:hypothetical protein
MLIKLCKKQDILTDYDMTGADCPYCEDEKLVDMGYMTKLEAKILRYRIPKEDFDLDEWIK